VRGDAANLDDLDPACSTRFKREKERESTVLYASARHRRRPSHWAKITEQHFDATFGPEYARARCLRFQKALPLFCDGGSIFMTGVSCFGERLFPGYGVYAGEQGRRCAHSHAPWLNELKGQEYPGERG